MAKTSHEQIHFEPPQINVCRLTDLPVAEHWNGGPHELAARYMKLCIRNSRKFNIAVCPARSFSSCTTIDKCC